MTYVVGVSGPIGAGKSVVADELAAVYAGVRRSFGAVVRRRAKAMGRPLDRDSLQEVGDEIIATDGWDAFCRDVLGETPEGGTVVIDGIRHLGAIDALTAIVGGTRFRLLYIAAPRDERLARVIARDGITEVDFDAAEAHPNESELPLVRSRNHVEVENTEEGEPLAPLVQRITAALAAEGFDPTSR